MLGLIGDPHSLSALASYCSMFSRSLQWQILIFIYIIHFSKGNISFTTELIVLFDPFQLHKYNPSLLMTVIPKTEDTVSGMTIYGHPWVL